MMRVRLQEAKSSADKLIMKAVALRFIDILGGFFIAFAVVGLAAWSPVTLALGMTGWFLCRASTRTLLLQSDIYAPSPHVQYWGRGLLLRTLALMLAGAVIGWWCIHMRYEIQLSTSEEVLLTAMLIAILFGVTRFALPGFFAASWEVHGAPERRKRGRSSLTISRFIVRTLAFAVLVSSIVGTYKLIQSVDHYGARTTALMQVVGLESTTSNN